PAFQSNSGASLANTSSIIAAGTASSFRPLRAPRVERPRLIATNNPRSPGAGIAERDGKTRGAGEIAAGRDRHHNRHLGQPIEGIRRDDEHRSAPLLLMTADRIERAEIDIA